MILVTDRGQMSRCLSKLRVDMKCIVDIQDRLGIIGVETIFVGR